MYTKTNKSISLTNEQIQVIIGTVLGDASLTKSRNKRKTACIRFNHSISQKEYVWYKYSFLKSLSRKPPMEYTNWRKIQQTYYTKIDFSSVYTEELYNFDKMFYPNGKDKIIPKNIKDYLTPLSISIWYMDDGSIETIKDKRNGKIHYVRNQINLHTNCFSKNECIILCKTIYNKFRIKFRIKSVNKNKHHILICRSRNDIEKFISMVKPYMHETMLYKITTSYAKPIRKPKYNKQKLLRIIRKLNLHNHKDFIKYKNGKKLYNNVRYYFGSLEAANKLI